jgi:hypothetical protein
MFARKRAPPKNARNNGERALDPHHHLSGFEPVDSFLHEISGSSNGLGAPSIHSFSVYECRMEKLN